MTPYSLAEMPMDWDKIVLTTRSTAKQPAQTCKSRQRTISVRLTYNAASQVLTSTNADDETTTHVYDVRGRLTSTTDGNNITTSHTYDKNNNRISLTDGKGDQRQWLYDKRNLVTTKTYPSTRGNDFYTITYDALRRLVVKTDQQQDSCTSSYDLAGRLTTKKYHRNGTTLESTDRYSYDAASRIIRSHKGRHNITTQHSFAPDGQALTETLVVDGRSYTTSRAYDAANRPTRHTYPSGAATHWAYTARNLVNTVHYQDKIVVTQTHDAGYRLTNQTFGNGLNRTITYSRRDNLRTTDAVAGKNDLNLSYSYAADKQITAENIVGDVLRNSSFRANYDGGNRLSAWTRAGAPVRHTQTWNYDKAGNWNSTTKDSNTENRNHSAADQVTSIAGNATTNDAKGNLTEYELNGTEYEVEYDLDNRITKVEVDNDEVAYRYDAFGRRIIRKEGSTKTALIWWGDSECAEHKHRAGQTVIQNDIFSHPTRLNAVIARAVDGSKFKLEWYHKNYLDHVYAVSNKRGKILEHYRYSAFGEVEIYNPSGLAKATTQINNQILWNTRRKDPVSGYYMYKYRHYSPELGRWLSRDPIEEEGGFNLFIFVRNGPIVRFDIFGLACTVVPDGNGGFKLKCTTQHPWQLDVAYNPNTNPETGNIKVTIDLIKGILVAIPPINIPRIGIIQEVGPKIEQKIKSSIDEYADQLSTSEKICLKALYVGGFALLKEELSHSGTLLGSPQTGTLDYTFSYDFDSNAATFQFSFTKNF